MYADNNVNRYPYNLQTAEMVRLASNGNGEIYRLQSGHYLKIGSSENESTNGMQGIMSADGYPVPAIINEGIIESSDGGLTKYVEIEDMGPTYESVDSHESPINVSEFHFGHLLSAMSSWVETQSKHRLDRGDIDVIEPLFVDELIGDMQTVLPEAIATELTTRINAIIPQLKERLSRLPIVYNHGDFVPRNITEKGVIDLEYAHEGTIGFDPTSLVFHPFMFPRAESGEEFEDHRTYELDSLQIQRMLDVLSSVDLGDGESLVDYIDDLIIAKLLWSAGDNGAKPNLQQWRFRVLDECLKAYNVDRPYSVASTLTSIDTVLENRKELIVAESMRAMQSVHGDNLEYGLICGGFSRGRDYRFDVDIDMVAVTKEIATADQKQNMNQAYLDIHKKYLHQPDLEWGVEQFSVGELEQRLGLTAQKPPKEHLKVSEIDLYDGIVLASMHSGKIEGPVGNHPEYRKNRLRSQEIMHVWISSILGASAVRSSNPMEYNGSLVTYGDKE